MHVVLYWLEENQIKQVGPVLMRSLATLLKTGNQKTSDVDIRKQVHEDLA